MGKWRNGGHHTNIHLHELMEKKKQLLELLDYGCTGTDLARRFGCSRALIEKAVKAARAENAQHT